MSTFDGFVDDASGPDGHDGSDGPAGPPQVSPSTAFMGARLVRDVDLPSLRGYDGPLAVVVTGGAGQVAGPAALCARTGLRLVRLEVGLRDLEDLATNARRVVAAVDDARASGTLADDVEVRVELPATGAAPSAGWLGAADEVSGADLGLTLRLDGAGGPGGTGGTAGTAGALAMLDAALDRELAFGWRGLTRAVPDGPGSLGFLNVLAATVLLFDGLPNPASALESRDVESLLGRTGGELARGRRWFRSFASADVATSLDDLAGLAARLDRTPSADGR